jgi:WD40 repeat protein
MKCLKLVRRLRNRDGLSRIPPGSVRYAIHNWPRHLPNEGLASGVAIFGDDDQAFLRTFTSAAALRKSVVSVSGDYGTHIYDPRQGFPPPAPSHFSHSSTIEVGDRIGPLAVSMDGRLIAAGSFAGDICLWDSKSHNLIGGPLKGHSGTVNSVCFSPDSHWLVSGCGDKSVRVWDCQTGQAAGLPLLGHTEAVRSVCTDGRLIISGSHDETIRIWDLATGKQIDSHINARDYVFAVTLSNDGRIAAGVVNTVCIWDVKTRCLLSSMEGHKSVVWTAAFSPDSSRIASGSADHTIRLWDTQTYMQIHKFTGHTDSTDDCLLS